MDFTLACWPVFPLCLVPKEFSRNEPSVHFVHNRLTLAQQGLSGALLVYVSLPWSKNLTQGHTEPSFFFCSKNEFTPPPKGGGAGVLSCSAHFLVMRSPILFRGKSIRLLSAGAFGNCCSQPARTPPTGPVWGIAGVRFPTQLSKPHTGPHGAEFGFTPFSGALLLL